MNHPRSMLAALLLALPIGAMAEEIMTPGIPYLIRGSDDPAVQVIFHPDGRVLVRNGEGMAFEHDSNWYRRDGRICMVLEGVFDTMCMNEIAGEDGDFSLVTKGYREDYTPLPQ